VKKVGSAHCSEHAEACIRQLGKVPVQFSNEWCGIAALKLVRKE